VLLILMVEHH